MTATNTALRTFKNIDFTYTPVKMLALVTKATRPNLILRRIKPNMGVQSSSSLLIQSAVQGSRQRLKQTTGKTIGNDLDKKHLMPDSSSKKAGAVQPLLLY